MAEQYQGPVHVIAEVQDLAAVRDQMRQLRQDLQDSAELDVSHHIGDTGDEELPGAVYKFINGWRDGRQQIDEKLDSSDKLLTFAVDTYVAVENALSTALTPGFGAQ